MRYDVIGDGGFMSEREARQTAHDLAERSYRRGNSWRLIQRLTGRSPWLPSPQTADRTASHVQRVGQIRSIRIDEIGGSESPTREYDARFHRVSFRSSRRWIDLATRILHDGETPPARLIRVGDRYYVRNGLEQISIARVLGRQFIDAEILESISDQIQPEVKTTGTPEFSIEALPEDRIA